jgi:hypothetical protein
MFHIRWISILNFLYFIIIIIIIIIIIDADINWKECRPTSVFLYYSLWNDIPTTVLI